MSFSRDNKPDEELYQACLNGDTAAVRRLLDTRSATDQIYGYGHVPLYLACFGGHRETVSLLMVRKHVIGPPAEHNGRRFEHLAPHIASFVAPTGKFSWANTAVLPSDDDEPPEDVFYDSENDEYYDY